MTAIPSSFDLNGSAPIGMPTLHGDWSIRNEIRARAPCPVCQQPAFLDPPCTITDMRTGVTRVEQNINCTKCNTAHHWRPGMTRNQQAALKEKQANGATLCLCGCGQFCRPGRPYLKGHKAQAVPPVIRDHVKHWESEVVTVYRQQEEEPMVATATIWCPCKCGKPVSPGRKFAARGCVGRAKRGVPIAPEVLAKRSETIRKARGKTAGRAHESIKLTPPVNTEPKPDLPCTMENDECGLCGGPVLPDGNCLERCELDHVQQLGGAGILAYTPEIQKLAKQALDTLRKAEQSACPYQTVAELARNHDAKTLRAAANLRDMVGAQ